MPATFEDLCLARFSQSDFSRNGTLMPHPLTTGILLFLHLRAPVFLEAPSPSPVSHHSAVLWLPSPPFCGSVVLTKGPMTAFLLHPKQIFIPSSCY